MELDSYIKNYFDIGDVDIRTYSPLTLAYIGDCVYEIIIRTIVVGKGNRQTSKLHQTTTKLVKAHSQAVLAELILPMLTEEEADILRRGRNAKSATMAKNATVADYRMATALEALVGYLYLTNKMDRLLEIIKYGLEKEEFAWLKEI
ncbi:MAG: ribonuclease III [Lachnospiraceae bacterium]|nr:ribonuclease III [Lachnospiraceae bacterium]